MRPVASRATTTSRSGISWRSSRSRKSRGLFSQTAKVQPTCDRVELKKFAGKASRTLCHNGKADETEQKPGRGLRVADQIQRDVAEMVQREVPTERAGLVTLTGVEVTPDYAHAKVYFTTIGAPSRSRPARLNEKAGYFHSLLFKRLSIHTIPKLTFVHDTSVEHGIEIDRLIAEAEPGPTRLSEG